MAVSDDSDEMDFMGPSDEDEADTVTFTAKEILNRLEKVNKETEHK